MSIYVTPFLYQGVLTAIITFQKKSLCRGSICVGSLCVFVALRNCLDLCLGLLRVGPSMDRVWVGGGPPL